MMNQDRKKGMRKGCGGGIGSLLMLPCVFLRLYPSETSGENSLSGDGLI